MSENTVIEIAELTSQYGDRTILDGVSMTVRRGEIFVIMGRSGAGKSTLLRHILGLDRPASGRVELLGMDVTSASRKDLFELRKQIGVAFQGGALLGSLSLIENVELPLRRHSRLDDVTIGIMSRMKLELMDLAGFEHLMPSQLSGGMLKRAGLARAVIMDPKILFFDEPSAGLDPVTSAELDELILRLRGALGMTIVIITHEVQSALDIADRIAVLEAGRFLMTGSVEEVRASEDPRIRGLLDRKPREQLMDSEAYLNRLTGRN
ncbi:MAG: ATP-binding cassette domain-containing protein [Gammaproteobacteria bacterium]